MKKRIDNLKIDGVTSLKKDELREYSGGSPWIIVAFVIGIAVGLYIESNA